MEPSSGVRARRSLTRPLAALGAAAGLLGGLALAAPALAQTPAGAPFTDISGNPEATAITFLASGGVISGYANGTFEPNSTITRAQFASIVVHLLGPKAVAAAAALANTTPPFSDAKAIPVWSWGDVNYAAGQGLVTGYPNKTFEANNPVTMVEAAAILARAVGDSAAVPSGTYPSNYTLAAYNLGLATGVTFVANLPADRGDAAQMAYNAAVSAPTLQAGYVSGTPTGAPLYFGGAGFPQTVWSGTVEGVTSTSISMENAQGASVLSAPLAETYYLIGSSAIGTLQGLQATVAENSSGQVDFIEAQSGTSTQNGTLATAAVATPSGYSRLSDFLVGDSTGDALLLSNGSLIPLVSTTSNGGTAFYLNAPTAGPSADPHALVSGVSNLSDGDSVTVTTGTNGNAVAVYAEDNTAPYGVVSAVNATGGTLTYTTGSSDNTTTTVAVPSWTDVTLNGATSSLANLEAGDVVAVQIVGDGNGGDTNARAIADTRQTLSGTIASLTSQTGPNGTTTVLGVTASNGQTTDVTEDPSFDSGGISLAVGDATMLVLDGQGQARQIQSLSAQETVVLVQGVQTTTNQTGTYNQVVVNNGGQSQAYDLATGVPVPAQPPAGGYLAVLTFEPGTSTVQSVTQLVQSSASYTLKVVSDSGGYALLQQYDSTGQAAGNPLVVSQSAGAVVYDGTTFEPFSSLAGGTVVTLWATAQGTYLGIVE